MGDLGKILTSRPEVADERGGLSAIGILAGVPPNHFRAASGGLPASERFTAPSPLSGPFHFLH